MSLFSKKIASAGNAISSSGNVYHKMSGLAFISSFWFAIVALGILVCYSMGETESFLGFCKMLGLVVVIAFASAAVGGMIGFLFGIPHTLQQSTLSNTNSTAGPKTPSPVLPTSPTISPVNAGTTEPTITATSQTVTPTATTGAVPTQSNFAPSTNLEQIADWLTKIIVGVGLVELRKILNHFNTLCLSLGETLKTYSCSNINGSAVAGAIILIFIVVGFLIVYLWTYLYLIGIQNSMLDVDSIMGSISQQMGSITQHIADTDKNDKQAVDLANIQLTLSAHTTDTPVDVLAAAFSAASQNIISSIFFKAVSIRKQNWQDSANKYRIDKTIPIFRALIKADKNFEFPENYLELAYALITQSVPDYQGALDNLNFAIQYFGKDNGRIKNKAIAYFNRAYCYIMVDPNYLARTASAADAQTRIKSDLLVASADSYVKSIIDGDQGAIKNWKSLNL